nr:chromogranin-A isoform X2 [Geotrypetes seraphini]
MNQDDAKVMKCIVEVISDTLSKPNPLPISAECLEILRGDERIKSILWHQNLLKELQELATEGARERERQEKKSQGFEDELSEVLESQKDGNIERDKSGEVHSEENTFMEAGKEKNEQNSEKDTSDEKARKSLEEKEPLDHESNLEEGGDDKQEGEELEHNDIDDVEEMEKRNDGLDNHIADDFDEYELPKKKSEESEVRPEDSNANLELEEDVTEKYFEEKKKEAEKSSKEQDNNDNTFDKESHMEREKSSSHNEDEEEEEETEEEENSINSSENQDALGVDRDKKNSEDKSNSSENQGKNSHSKDEEIIERGGKSHEKETEEESSREMEDAKRWNKMDELAKQLTSSKRMEERESQEDPDRSMKIPFKTHKYDFQSQESDTKHSGQHHSKEDSREKGRQLPVRLDPEEKKEEEGSANRRTEDQDSESLAAIEAELEKVAHKLHELRSG